MASLQGISIGFGSTGRLTSSTGPSATERGGTDSLVFIGASGYAAFLDAMADPSHPEHAEQSLWLEEVYGAGELDPEAFDAEAVSRLLRIAATGELAADDTDFFDR